MEDIAAFLGAHPPFHVLRAYDLTGIPAGAPPADPVQRPAGALIRTPPLLCQGGEPIREAARRMTEQGVSAVLVPLGGSFGIVTDRDLRTKVIAAGLSPDAPVSAIMTEPAYTVTADRLGGDVLLDMLERNVHHVPVLSLSRYTGARLNR